MEPLAVILGTDLSRAYALSALPDAPVVPPAAPRPSRTGPVRRATAVALHRLADLVEPRAASVARPAVR
jgi:hypothetical protein